MATLGVAGERIPTATEGEGRRAKVALDGGGREVAASGAAEEGEGEGQGGGGGAEGAEERWEGQKEGPTMAHSRGKTEKTDGIGTFRKKYFVNYWARH